MTLINYPNPFHDISKKALAKKSRHLEIQAYYFLALVKCQCGKIIFLKNKHRHIQIINFYHKSIVSGGKELYEVLVAIEAKSKADWLAVRLQRTSSQVRKVEQVTVRSFRTRAADAWLF